VGGARPGGRAGSKFKVKNSKLQLKVQSFGRSGISKVFLLLTILLAPLYVVRFNVGFYPSTLLEVLIVLTAGVWFFEKFRRREFEFPAAISNQQVAIFLFLFAAAISVVVSPDKRGALGIFKAYFVEPLLIYVVINDVIRSKRDWELIFAALALSGLWVALLAVFQGLTGQLTFTSHEAALGRAHAVYNTANAVGLYLGPIAFLLLGVLSPSGRHKLKGQRLKLRFLILVAILLLILSIYFSKSAGAVVGLAAALVVWGLLRVLGGVRGLGVLGLAGLVVATFGIWFFFNISSFTPKNVDPYVRKTNNTLQFRLCLWEGTRDLLLDRPVFAAGLSGFKELYAQKYFTCDAEPLEYPHNWVLNFWAETGILGLAAFILLLVSYFRTVAQYLSDPKKQWLALGFIAAMVYWLVHGLVDVPYFKNDLSLEFWVIVGLAGSLGRDG
jgi:O-antigen ligase